MSTCELGEVVAVRSSLVDPTEDRYGHLPHIAPDTIERDTGRLLPYKTVEESGVQSGKYRFEPGDVLYSKIRPNLNKVALVNFGGLCSADMYALHVDQTRLTAPFLQNLLRSPLFVDYATNLSSRANIPKVNRDQLLRFSFRLPPVDQQRRIAAILDRADDIRTKQSRLVSHLDALPEAIFLDMFGDPGDGLASRSMVRFGDIADLQGGRNLVADDQHTVSEFRVLKISAVTSGEFKSSESKALPTGYVPPPDHFVRPGDLLISRANTAELVGAVAYVEDTPSDLVLPDKVWRFVWRNPDSVPLYYRSLFRTASVRRRISQLASGTGGSMKNISKAKLMELELPMVTVHAQREFARRVQSIPRPSRAKFDELCASLQSRAFSGQL